MREDLISKLRDALETEPSVAAAYLYGSVARSAATPLSDVDVAVVVTGDLDDRLRDELLRRATRRLGGALAGSRVEIRLLDELPAAIAGRAVTEGLLVFERDPVARLRAEVRARMLYFDFQPFERRGTREGLAGLRRSLGVG